MSEVIESPPFEEMIMKPSLGLAALLTLNASFLLAAPSAGLDAAKIEALTGLKGRMNEKEGVFKVSYPRSDIDATAAGVRLTPPMGLTAWAAFQTVGTHAMVMGDMVLLEDQVNPVMSAALDNGLEVTALHNHFLWDSPKIMFMHIGGMGPADKLAAAVGAVFAELKATSGGKGGTPKADIDPAKTSLDPKPLEEILAAKGDFAHGVLKLTFNRATRMGGHEVGGAMGVNTWAAFAGSDEKAVVDGDFATAESELQGVLKALRHAGIDIAAIHNHMTTETPRMVFLHYWGIGAARDLAKGLRAALDSQKK
jgi:hypothetical protein